MGATCTQYTLAETVDRFLIRSGIEKKKYFGRYMVTAQEVWEDVFQNTLWVMKSVWVPTKAGSPYNYIDVPADCLRLLGVETEDKCGLIQPLFYNNQLNVVVKPKDKKCGCSCNCGGLCDAVNSTIVQTKLLFTINNVPYYQKTWIQYCPNGDVIEWTETPTKKYNNTIGDGGDYNADYNEDYLIGAPPFSDYTIETIKSQKKVCKLETQPCGCPIETPQNEEVFFGCCSAYVNLGCCNKRKHCRQFSENINNNHYGEVKISECGTKVYYRPNRHWRLVTNKEIPDYLLITYQTTGKTVGQETLIPQYARNLMYACLDYARKEYNGSFSMGERQEAYYKREDEKAKLTAYLSPITIEFLAQVQDAQIKF
jgi:hypothetical protein